MTYKYGDIVVVDFSVSKGAEIQKMRPCVLVSRDTLHELSPFAICVPLTSNTTKVLSCHVLIPPSPQNRLEEASKALPEQIKSIDKRRITKKVGTLETPLLRLLERKIRFVLNQG